MPVSDYDALFEAAGREWNIDPRVLRSVAQQESGGKPGAVSSAGATGVMQIMPATGKDLGMTDLRDPAQSIFAGAKYLSQMVDRYRRPDLALAAYNAGPERVDDYLAGKGALPAETAAYVPAVAAHYRQFATPYVVGDSLAAGVKSAGKYDGTAQVGAAPDAVLKTINDIPADTIKGRDVVLSSGASNNPAQADLVAQQIAALKAKGAGNVTLLGVGDRPDFSGVNDKLTAVADQSGARFRPLDPTTLAADRVHPKDYTTLADNSPSTAAKPAPDASRPPDADVAASWGVTLPGGAPAASTSARGRPSDDEILKAWGVGSPDKSQSYPVVPLHPPPDGSGGLTNLSDADYAKFMQQVEADKAKQAAAAAAPQPQTQVPAANGEAPPTQPAAPQPAPPGIVTRGLGVAAGALGSAVNGLSFGLDRPLNALTNSILPDWWSGAQTQQKFAQDQANFQTAHPLISAGAEAVGALPTYALGEGALAGVMPSMTGAGMVSRGVNALASGARNAALGAAAGAGMSDGDMSDRIDAARTGAVVGAVAPPLLGAAASVIGKGAAPIVARFGNGAADTAAVRKIGEALSRDAIAPADAVAQLRSLGPNAALVDAGGANVRRLGETIANMPGDAAQQAESFLETRAAGQGSRLNAAVTGATGSTGDFHTALGDLAQQRAMAAAPKYDAAFNRIVVTPEEAANVQRFIHDSIGQDALQKGMRVIQLEKLAADVPFNPAEYGVARGEDGRFVLNSGAPNLRLMDAVKRGYDEIVEGFRDPTSGRLNLNQYGRAVNDVRAAYVKDLREMFPRYGSALDAWAGPSRAMDALGMGRRALSNDPEVTAKVIKGLPAADKEFFLTGVARALKDKIEGAADGADATRRIFGNKLIRDKIAAAFDNPAAYDEFKTTLEREALFSRTRNEVLKGSQTARRTAGQQDVGFDVLSPTLHAASGNYGRALMNIGRQGMNALARPSPTQSGALGRMLFTPQPTDPWLAALSAYRNPLAVPLAQRAGVLGVNRVLTLPAPNGGSAR